MGVGMFWYDKIEVWVVMDGMGVLEPPETTYD